MRVNLTVPNLAWGYPMELGGGLYNVSPASIGEHTRAFHEQLRRDCEGQGPECKWWDETRCARTCTVPGHRPACLPACTLASVRERS